MDGSNVEQHNKVQVITDDLDYSRGLDKFLKEHGLYERQKDYRSVAVIGCQSSGKSTLLNILFETNFETMDDQKGRQQTTKGVWMSRSANKTTLIFDIEGTDSKERGEQRMTFEQTTSLFALAIADVLMINMWTTDIGRYGASNYGLLKVIFECNLKLFGQASSKKLMFVLRDFDDRGNNTQRITDLLKTDITNIWNEIHKPEQFKDKKAEDFFDFEYCMIPHKIYEEERFHEKTKLLKGRFENLDGSGDSVYLPRQGEDDNIPIDGLSVFIDQTWEVIRNQKELNLPDQREMVANYRCNEIKDEAIQKAEEDISNIKKQTDKKIVDDFKKLCQVPIKSALDHYDENAKQYQTKVYEKVKKEVEAAIYQGLFMCFDQQLKLLRVESIKQSQGDIHKLSKKDIVNDNFFNQSKRIRDTFVAEFVSKGKELVIEGTEWEESVQGYLTEVEHAIDVVIRNQREKEIAKLEALTMQATYETVEEIVSGPIYELNHNFWEEISGPYKNEVVMVLENCSTILQSGFEASHDEQKEFLVSFEDNIRNYSKNYIKKLFRDINTNMLRKFNNLFKNDASGQQRNWVAIEEEDIRKMENKYKKQVLALLDLFKYIDIPNELQSQVQRPSLITPGGTLNLQPQATPGGGEVSDDDADQIKEEKVTHKFKSAKSISLGRLLSAQDLKKVQDKFTEDIENVLEEALRKHHNISQGNTPMWLYIVLAYFAYGDVLRWMSHPLIFTPLLLIVSGVALMYSMGMGPIMIPMAKQSANIGFRQAGIPYQL